MSRRTKLQSMTEQEYLQAEEKATVRHEYVDGYVFAMSGATEAHNVISGNLFSVIHSHLRGGPCRAFQNDMKVRVQSARSYYYPDIMVTCEAFEPKSVFKISPTLLIEVLSPSTAQIDQREKLIAYQKIGSLREYVIVHQQRQHVEMYRKNVDGQWEHIIPTLAEGLVLESLSAPLQIPFNTIYEGYNPPSRVKENERIYDLEYSDLIDV